MANFLIALDSWLPLALAATTIAYGIDFRRTDGPPRALPTWLLRITFAAMLARFFAFVAVYGRPALASPTEALGTIALAIVVVYGILEALHRDRSVAFPLLSLATIAKTAAMLGPPPAPVANELLTQTWFGFHAMSAILGYTGFSVGAVYAVLFLVLYSRLKRHQFGVFWDRLPPLDELATMAIRGAGLGFVFLTLAMVAGAFGWSRLLDHPVWQDPKVVSTFLAWLAYAIGLGLYHFGGWRGARCVWITLVAFGLMILSSWVVPALLGSSHGVSGLS